MFDEPSARYRTLPAELSMNTEVSAARRRIRLLCSSAAVATLFTAGALLCGELAAAPPPEVELAGFATSLQGRTHNQRHNAVLAAEMLNGAVIGPGARFSFNQRVKSWSYDRGYVKAPVSYDGELVRAYGGGVCQTSTTLYNAALLAGLTILERHAHTFAPHYVPPGRDAAVAQYDIDLQFKNPYRWPVRIRASANQDRLEVGIYGARLPAQQVEIESDLLEYSTPARYTRIFHGSPALIGHRYVRNPGSEGYRVATWRLFTRDGKEVKRERLGDDSYGAMDRVVQLDE